MVGQSAGLGQVMGHPHHGQTVVGETASESFDTESAVGIEGRGRLVHEHDLRCGQKGAGETHALGLATREVVGSPIQQIGREADGRHRLGPSGSVEIGAGHAQVLEHSASERRRALEHHADASSQVPRIEPGAVDAVEMNRALGGHGQAVGQSQQGRLARPRGPDQDRDPARLGPQRDSVQHRPAVTGHPRDPVHLQQSRRPRHLLSMTPVNRPS